MINIVDKSNCTGCSACVQICGKKAIRLVFDNEGHSYPNVDVEKCVNCGLCDTICPMQHKEIIPSDDNAKDPNVYAVYNKDSIVREKSTSGGIFTALAEQIIKEGGVVYAARFDQNFHIYHDSFSYIEQIDYYRGSKYAQSDLGEVFKRIRSDLKNKTVLFVGTPCQVAGLKLFLRKEHDNLYTCDFICMGISSSKHWEDYLKEFWSGKSINSIFFKDKRNGWHNWKMNIKYSGGEYLANGSEDPFFYGYVKRLTMRPSCRTCPFRTYKRISDFTIADAWGIDKTHPEFDDNKGCSTLILQSEKSEVIFEKIRSKLNVIAYSINDVIRYNPYIVTPITPHPAVDLFAKVYKEKGFLEAIKQCKHSQQQSLIKRLLKKIREII